MAAPALRPRPRPTNGHHFGSYLSCPRKAWFSYHAAPASQAPLPFAMRAIREEGLAHEERVLSTHYPDAVRVEGGSAEERLDATLAALRAGPDTILQAELRGEGATGVADLLERTDSGPQYPLGHAYRVGDVKLAEGATVGNVLQIAWYTQLLATAQGHWPETAFLLLGEHARRQEVPLRPVWPLLGETYEKLQSLLGLDYAVLEAAHPTAFSRGCLSCQWRYCCLPPLRDRPNLSLLPDLGPARRQWLARQHVRTLDDLLARPATDPDTRQWQAAARRLQTGGLLFRKHLRADLFRGAAVGAFELERPDGKNYRARALHYTRDGQTCDRVSIRYDADGHPTFEVPEALRERRLVLYGLDFITCRRLLRATSQYDALDPFDVFDFVEQYVHAPLPGLDLSELLWYVERGDETALRNPPPLPEGAAARARHRLGQLQRVARWLHAHLATQDEPPPTDHA